MVEIQSTIDKIQQADDKLDSQNIIDEQSVIDKINQTNEYFDKFEKWKLSEMKNKLPPEKYENLEKEFNKLKLWFSNDLWMISERLKIVDNLKEEEFSSIIKNMQDSFWWILEIQPWDNIWKLATKFLWLPKEWKLKTYSWFKMADWLVENEWVEENNTWSQRNLKIKAWDIMILPSEYTILKDLIKNQDSIDLNELIDNQKVKYTENFSWLDDLKKFNIKMIIIKYFSYKENTPEVSKLMWELIEEYRKKVPIDQQSIDFEKIRNNEGWKESDFCKLMMKNFEDTNNYDWFFWTIDWLKDGFAYWVRKQADQYIWLFDWDTWDKLKKMLDEISKDPLWILLKIKDELLKELVWLSNILTNPHRWGETLWKLCLNLVIWLLSWWVIWITSKVTSTILTKLPIWKVQSIALWTNATINFSAKVIQSATWISPKILDLKEFKKLSFKDKIKKSAHESMFYTDTAAYIVISEVKKIPKWIKELTNFNIKNNNILPIRANITPDWKTFFEISKNSNFNTTDFMDKAAKSTWNLWLWARRFDKPYELVTDKYIKSLIKEFFNIV